jgi:MFS family permease
VGGVGAASSGPSALGIGGGAIAPSLWEIAIALLVCMIGMAPINVVIAAYMIRLTPDVLIGRTSAVNRFGAMSLQWTGPLLAGLLADLLSPE